ncbi:MAG TPA: DNA polymerase elongation subunit, partial [Halobacteriales archaeon]|nr:DNA polymerase elongation subunit [Halobacteriales archaeon]
MGQSNLGFFGEEMKTGGYTEERLGIDLEEVGEKKLDGFVEIAVFQVNYTLKRIGDVEKPIIHVFGRTIENKAERVQVHGFRPYLYTLESSFDRDVVEGIPGVTGWERENEKGQPYVGIKGERLVKIYGQTPRDVGKFREEFDHYEADILFPNRFLIDK